MIKRCCAVAGISLSLLAVPALGQNAGNDVPPSHWAYQAVQDLAGKGLIQGYPPDNRFLGGRTLTRYEMATIIERVLTRMDQLLDQKADKADLDKLKSSSSEISDLVNEFKKELLVIGADLNQAKTDIATLQGQVSALNDKVNALDQRVTDANTLADQALENLNELKTTTNAALAKKVDVGTGRLRISGLLQVWAGTAFGKTLGGNFPTNTSSVPPGRNFGGGVGDTFRLRRGEIGLNGNITRDFDYRVMIDVAKVAGVNTTTGTFTTPTGTASAVTSVTSNAPSNVLQDLWVGYQIAPRWRIEVGQQKTGLSYEGTVQSSAALLTVERSIMNSLPVQNGRIGDIRDTGAMAKFANSWITAAVGIFNDNGATQNAVDNDRFKFTMANLYLVGIRNLVLGVWGGGNIGDSTPNNNRDRFGASLVYRLGPHLIQGEAATTRDFTGGNGTGAHAAGSSSRGGYIMYAYSANSRWQFVGRYDVWDPAYLAGKATPSVTLIGVSTPILRTAHDLREYTLGVNYYISGNNKIQLNYIWEDPEANAVGFFGQRRQILLGNFQAAF